MTTPYRMLAIDVDGTLVDGALVDGSDSISPVTQQAIARCVAAGVQVVLATGRQYRRTLPLATQLGLDLPLITASGALIKQPADHRTLFQASFEPKLLNNLLRILDDQPHEVVLYADTYADGYDYMTPRIDGVSPAGEEFFTKNQQFVRTIPDMMKCPPAGVFAGFAIGPEDAMHALHQQLEEHLPEQLYIHVLRSPRYAGFMCEIAPAEVTKWSGILHLAEMWGIVAEEICAVGDDVNDIPMLQGAGLGVAVANAKPAVKAVADRIAPSNENDGLVQVARWVLGEE